MDIKGDINRNMVIAGDLTHHWLQWMIFQAENQQGDSSLKWHTRSNGFNWYLQSISLQRAEYT